MSILTIDTMTGICSHPLRVADDNQSKAARWLGVTRSTMHDKLLHLGLHLPMPEPQNGLENEG